MRNEKSVRFNYNPELIELFFQKIDNHSSIKNLKQTYLRTTASRRGTSSVFKGRYLEPIT